jgi:hypothetical protein
MILTKRVEIKIKNNRQYENYKKKHNVSYGDVINIPVYELTIGSSVRIKVKCDICDNIKFLSYSKYIKNIKKYNIYSCSEKCSQIKNKKTNFIKYGSEKYNNVKKIIESNIKSGNFLTQEQKIDNKINIIEQGYKKCIKCKLDKDLSNFISRKNSKDGYNNICKECKNIDRNIYYENNKKILKPIMDKRKIKYIENNKDKINKRQREYYHKKFKHTNKHNFIWRSVLSTTLKRLGKNKESKTIELLGYSALCLKNHLEGLFLPEMSWENYGEWQIDHIVPVASFDKNDDVSVVCALSNLQPMWATTREINGIIYEGNLNKGKKIYYKNKIKNKI